VLPWKRFQVRTSTAPYCTDVRARRTRFKEVIATQLDLFEREDHWYLEEVARALDRYNGAGADEAEELYGDYQLAIEAATDRLAESRDAYAATLEDRERYVEEFDRAVSRRWPALALTIEES
jgi:ribosome-binding protein aMBF1 (putative translation factor)